MVDVGEESDGVSVFGWGLRAPVFANVTGDEDAMGDGAYLFDPLGNIRASMIYPCRFAAAPTRSRARSRSARTPTGSASP